MAYTRKQIGSVLVTKDEKLKYKDEKGNHTYVWHARVVGHSPVNLDNPDL